MSLSNCLCVRNRVDPLFRFDVKELHTNKQTRTFSSYQSGFLFSRSIKIYICFRFIWPFVCVVMSLIGIVLELMSIVHSLSENDLHKFTESFAYFVIVSVVPILYYCTFSGAEYIYKLVDRMESDFLNICSLGQPFRWDNLNY